MIKPKLKSTLLALSALAVAFSAQAGTFINNFDTSQDYVANGIIGEPKWDGVFLQFGDIPGGNPGGSGNGITIAADANNTVPGYFSVRTTRGDWAGAGDDGFYLYKVVSGDFDVSVQSAPTWDTTANHFAGLLVRAYNPNNSGAPYSTTSPNLVENWIALMRGQEFNIDEVRFATNGADNERVFSDPIAGITETRYFRIVRSAETNFTFFWKVNAGDAWTQLTNGASFPNGVFVRSDLAGVKMQVGINQALFSGNQATAYFTDFELTGPNVSSSLPAFPAAPSGLITTATNIGGSLTFSWNVGNPGDSSLAVMRVGGVVQQNPVQGMVYPANAQNSFGDPTTRLGDANEYVVYNGTGTSVTVTNLAGNNLNYVVAVYEYTNAAAPVYNTQSPIVISNAGPGIITGVITSIAPTNIPVGGATLGTLLANFSSGGGTVDESAFATWTSSDPSIAYFTANVLTALTPGSLTVTGEFNGFTATATITVAAPAFTDNFGTTQDYIASGLIGSTWDGLYLNFGDVPNAKKGPDNAAGATSRFIANTNVLTIEAAGSSWWVDGNDGPFIYKIVSGDFQAVVHVGPMSTINNCDAGLMARLFDNSGSATQGGGGGTGGTETHIKWAKVQNGTPQMRQTVDSGGTTIVNGINATDRWLLMQRVNSTNFYLFQSSDPTIAGWSFVTKSVIAEAANNALMQVGLEQEMRTASDGTAPLDSLMIDGPGILSPVGLQPPPPATNLTVTLNGDLSMTYNWVAESNGVPVASILVMRAGGPVTAQPTYGIGLGANSQFGAGQNLGGGNYVVYKSPNVPTSTNNSVTVTGLTPGVIYYAAVYTYDGPFGTRVFNNVVPPGGTAITQDGSLISIQTLPLAPMPKGGVGQLQVMGVFNGGASVNVSPFATLTSADPSIVAIANGVLTGITNGTTTVQVVYGGFTNSATVTVRDPVFTDNYSVNHDYLNDGVAGTPYDGVYNPNGLGPNPGVQIPESVYVPPSYSGATVADANVTSNGVLTIVSAGDGWENDASGGFFLFKYVPGDFQVAVHLNSFIVNGYNMPGLLARAYSTGTNGMDIGAPFVLGESTNSAGNPVVNGESWVSLCRFDEFGIGTYARLNLDSAVLQSTQPDTAPGDTNYWLLIVRSSGTNFNFYKRSVNTEAWKPLPLGTSYQVKEFEGVPMQVGIMAEPWNGGDQYNAQFDSFMLDYSTGAPLNIVNAGNGNVIISWPANPNSKLESTTSLSPTNWQPVPGTPTLGVDGYSLTVPIGTGNQFFRLKN